LLEAARARDGLLARRIMVEHLHEGYDSFVAWLDTIKSTGAQQ
jgi:DNA-binding GntR family transcriptional regulator